MSINFHFSLSLLLCISEKSLVLSFFMVLSLLADCYNFFPKIFFLHSNDLFSQPSPQDTCFSDTGYSLEPHQYTYSAVVASSQRPDHAALHGMRISAKVQTFPFAHFPKLCNSKIKPQHFTQPHELYL